MYRLIFLLSSLVFSTIANGQCDLLTSETDKFTGTSSTGTELFDIENEGETLVWSLTLKKNTLSMALASINSGCIDDNAPVIFLFRDGEKVKRYSSTKFNCEGLALIRFDALDAHRGKTLTKKFIANEIDAVRIYYRKRIFDYSFTSEQSAAIRQVFECVMEDF